MAQQRGQGDEETLDLGAIEEEVGDKPRELPAEAKARLTLAYVVLGGVAGLFLLSWAAVLCVPDGRLEYAQALFEFAKTFGPPIVTLVLGFYFRSEGS